MRRRMRRRWLVHSETGSWAASLRHLADGGNDVWVSGAPADIAAHALRDLRIGQSWRCRDVSRRITWPACLVLGQHRDRRANLTRGAIAALQSVMAHKCGLHRVEIAVFFQTLDGRDLVARMHHGKRQAAVDALSIDDHRTGAALSLVAALLRAGQAEMLAQCIEQRYARIEIESMAPSIDSQRHALVVHRCAFRRGFC